MSDMNYRVLRRLFDKKNEPRRLSTQSAIFFPVHETISNVGALSVKGGYQCFMSGSLVLMNSLNLSFLPILKINKLVTKAFFRLSIFFSSAFGSFSNLS